MIIVWSFATWSLNYVSGCNKEVAALYSGHYMQLQLYMHMYMYMYVSANVHVGVVVI